MEREVSVEEFVDLFKGDEFEDKVLQVLNNEVKLNHQYK